MSYYAQSRRGKRLIVVPVDPTLHRRLKIAAASHDQTLEAVCQLALEQYLVCLPTYPKEPLP